MKIFLLLISTTTLNVAMGKDIDLSCGSSVNLSGLDDRFVIKSHPNFDRKSKYSHQQTCGYVVTPVGSCSGMSVSCEFMMISGNQRLNCNEGDYLLFDNGDNIREKKVCGVYLRPPCPSFSTSSKKPLSVTFKTNDRDANAGFKCFISCGQRSSALPTPQLSPGQNSAETCVCGVKGSPLRSRIIGGVEAGINEFPWQVGLIAPSYKVPICGATLVRSNWIITAAHCVLNLPSDMKIILGEYDHTKVNDTRTIVTSAKRRIVHPDYNAYNSDFDFALVELNTNVNFTDYTNIRPICMPTVFPPDGAKVTATGWGVLQSYGKQPNVLMKVDVNMISTAVCNPLMDNGITPQMFCAGNLNGGKDACQGDSGGPLIYENGGNWELPGIVSWGFDCALPKSPGVYAKLAIVKDWYTQYLGSGDGCPRR